MLQAISIVKNLNQCLAYEVGMQQITLKNHDREANSWYVSDRPGVFNPYNSSDRISRKTWYENVTAPDILRRRFTMIDYCNSKKPFATQELFERLSIPKPRYDD